MDELRVPKEEYEVLTYPKLQHVEANTVQLVCRNAHIHRAWELCLVLEQGMTPAYIAVGAAAGLYRYIQEAEGLPQGMDATKQVLTQVSGLEADSPLTQLILPVYDKILSGASVEELRRTADVLKAASLGEII